MRQSQAGGGTMELRAPVLLWKLLLLQSECGVWAQEAQPPVRLRECGFRQSRLPELEPSAQRGGCPVGRGPSGEPQG